VALEEDEDRTETFSSDIIDLSGLDLSALDSLPSGVLRASVERVWRELARPGQTAAFFQSTLRDGTPERDPGASG
jgi:FXSXX-COOH protein